MKLRIPSHLVFTFLTAGSITSSLAQLPTPISGPVFDPGNGHTYYLLSSANWTDSQAEAVTLGGNLATVRNADENAFIFYNFADFGGEQRFLWLGLNDAAAPGTFVWASGESATYRNWAVDEPDDLNGNELWVQMFPANAARGSGYPPADPGTWNDVVNAAYPYQGNPSGNNFGPVYGVVEVVPEPGATTIAVVAVGCWMLGRLGFGNRGTRSDPSWHASSR